VNAAKEPTIEWREADVTHAARWCSPGGVAPPRRVLPVDDTLRAEAAYRLACEGTALLWRGDFQNARQLLQALARRLDRKARGEGGPPGAGFPEAFHRQRMAQAQRAHLLGRLLIPFEAGHLIPLRRAPDVHEACEEVLGKRDEAYVLSLRELLGLIGAHEWRKKGVFVPALGEGIHPHHGVFSPVRGEYVALVNETPLPAAASRLALDVGTGTGVLAAVLAKRGVRRVLATDRDERALLCARDNVARLGLGASIELIQTDLFPPGRAPLIVCNPPWIPGKPASLLEHAVYDPESRMLRGFLAQLAAHLEPGGEGWLILSDLAEHLKLRSRESLLTWIEQAGLQVLERRDVRPTHAKATDPDDPLHAARAAEVTSLWRLGGRETGTPAL
jgi:methylase of polypeptide subunit release factors